MSYARCGVLFTRAASWNDGFYPDKVKFFNPNLQFQNLNIFMKNWNGVIMSLREINERLQKVFNDTLSRATLDLDSFMQMHDGAKPFESLCLKGFMDLYKKDKEVHPDYDLKVGDNGK